MNNDEPIVHVSEDGQMEQEASEIKRMLATFIKKLRVDGWWLRAIYKKS